jgi:hypothetical protein
MRKSPVCWVIFGILCLALHGFTVTFAQEDSGVQELFGSISATNPVVFYDVFGLKAGQTIYVYAESDQFDTYLVFCDINCVDQFATDDDSGGDFNSALQFAIPQDGDYSIAIKDCCDQSLSGNFRLLIGLNSPDVLTGAVQPTGAEIAVPYIPFGDQGVGETTAGVQEFRGAISSSEPIVYYDMVGLQAGQTLYFYVESSDFDTFLTLCDITCETSFAEDDDGGGDFNSALQFTLQESGDYSIAISDCCDRTESGSFRLLIGVNAPDVLTGIAQPTGAELAVLYVPDTTPRAVTEQSGVQELTGSISPETPVSYFDIFGLQAGQTIYAYAESADFDAYLAFCDIDCEQTYIEDDDGGGGFNSALQFTITQSGDYSIAVLDCCSEDVSGEFRLLLSLDNPDVLTGIAQPTGVEIAVVYNPDPAIVGGYDHVETTNCSSLQDRPHLSGQELTRETQNFIIHYTDQGVDRATEPFIDALQKAIEEVLMIQTVNLGWPLPPSDCGEGGDTRFDVYVEETLADNTLGYARPGGIVVDNPNSDLIETWASYSFLVVDNDFSGTGAPIGVMRATVAHEFHHTIQFGYDINDALNWYYEATAAWMETQTFPEDEDATPYVPDLYQTTDLCIGHTPEKYETRLYAEWLLIDSLAQDYGPRAVERLWEHIAEVEGMPALYDTLEELGVTPQEFMIRFAVRNLLLDFALSYKFEDRVRIEADINRFGEIVPRQSGVEQLGVDYLLIRKLQSYTFSINQPNLRLYVVGINQPTGQAQLFDLGQSGTVDTTVFTNAYVLIQNSDLSDDPDTCTVTDWILSVSDGSTTIPLAPTGQIFNVSRFIAAE